MDFSQDVAIVTGAGRGIGQAIATALVSAGCRVVAAGNQPTLQEAWATQWGAERALSVACDITQRGDVDRMVALTLERFGPPTILVNNAGWDQIAPFVETDEADWWKTLDINLVGAMRCARAVLPTMLARRYGRIINVASDAGRVGSSGQTPYSAAKAGLIGFTKALAREMAREGITVNCVAPGPTRTPLLEEVVVEPRPHLLEAFLRAIPLRRLGEPAEVAHVVVMLAAREASYVTGQTVSVSGGLTMC